MAYRTANRKQMALPQCIEEFVSENVRTGTGCLRSLPDLVILIPRCCSRDLRLYKSRSIVAGLILISCARATSESFKCLCFSSTGTNCFRIEQASLIQYSLRRPMPQAKIPECTYHNKEVSVF